MQDERDTQVARVHGVVQKQQAALGDALQKKCALEAKIDEQAGRISELEQQLAKQRQEHAGETMRQALQLADEQRHSQQLEHDVFELNGYLLTEHRSFLLLHQSREAEKAHFGSIHSFVESVQRQLEQLDNQRQQMDSEPY